MMLAAAGGGSQTIKGGVVAELTGDIPQVGASCKNAADWSQGNNDAVDWERR
jgi:hypothetical protein